MPEITYHNLHTAVILIVSVILGGVGRRVGGGLITELTGIPVNNVVARFLFGLMISLLVYINGADHTISLMFAPLIVAGMYLSEVIGDVKSLHYKNNFILYIILSLIILATARVLFINICFMVYNYDNAINYMIISKLMAPIAYMIAVVYPIHCKLLGCIKLEANEYYSAPTFELIWGASLGISICLVLLRL